MADKYIIRVTAGPDYDMDSQQEVPVNSPRPLKFSTDLMDIELNVRVQNYRGLPRNSPSTSPYFDREPHKYNNDQYSISLKFAPKKPQEDMTTLTEGGERVDDEGEEVPDDVATEGISGNDLQFGNDFDHPIRDRLPPGFGTAMNIVKWWIDPGLEGDAYADKPYLYGAALSSFNAVHVGSPKEEKDGEEGGKVGIWVEEGGDQAGLEWRNELGVPEDGKKRMKWALDKANKEKWVWEYGRTYAADFYNPYIDFKDYALRLPGFNLPIMKYWDGQGLRYVSFFFFLRLVSLHCTFSFWLCTSQRNAVHFPPTLFFAHHRSTWNLSHFFVHSIGTTPNAHINSDTSFGTVQLAMCTSWSCSLCTSPRI